jgi:carbon-monoxide dehydrogenase small subunit
MRRIYELFVNGEPHELALEPQTTLVEALREQLMLTGTKEACGTGECGSCTVLMDGKPILSCLKLAVECQGRHLTTIEGVAQGRELSPVQQAFVDYGAVQCGFCTSGMVLSAEALLKENPRPTNAEICKALEGNLCRCTGYNKIIEAVHRASDIMAEKA